LKKIEVLLQIVSVVVLAKAIHRKTYELGDVAHDALLLHRLGLGPEHVARAVDGAENNLHTLGAKANFFVRVPPATTYL